MSSRLVLTPVFALAALVTPMALSAQVEGQPPPQVQEWIAEIQELSAQLGPLQQQAREDAEIKQEEERVTTIVRDAMIAADPANGQRLDRFETIIAEARAAQEAGDTAKIAELTSEAQQLQPQVQAAHEEALAQPEVETQIDAFNDKLQAKMVEMDPNAKESVERLNELNRRVSEALRRG